MEVTVKLFALLRSYAPPETLGYVFHWQLEEGSSIADLLSALRIPPELAELVLVNGAHSHPTERLHEGDVVSLFPALAGGS
ncbi:MAG: MoaD/ThiS family protein [Candidatus Tectomicrobia bacterium]|uniref:MoaD/ThiS family protein n=1 Tax=Tectimicrobiota bacterium TaxID=2528274 RepID=A0A932M1Z0_UNCTE|nr:MoaD/ThiS family protein [Candidatus Tectomicrobia bacterium]